MFCSRSVGKGPFNLVAAIPVDGLPCGQVPASNCRWAELSETGPTYRRRDIDMVVVPAAQELATWVETNRRTAVSGQVANRQVSSINTGQTKGDLTPGATYRPDLGTATANSGRALPHRFFNKADIGPFAARVYRGVYRYVAERAVIHGGMVDDRFAVAAVGRRSLEHWRGSGRPWLLSLHRVLGRGLVRLAANGPPVHGCLAFAMSAARMRLSGPAVGVRGPELRPAAARTTREAGGDAAYRAGWAGSSSRAGLPRSRRRTSISTESSRRPRPRSWPRR